MIILDAAGEEFARWVETGTRTAFCPSGGSLDAGVLCAVLTGQPVQFAGEKGPRRVAVPASGIRIENATITGKVDLVSARSETGRAMAPLILRRCTIADEVEFRRADIRFLSLRDCRLTHFDGRGLHVEESLDLSSIASAEATGSGIGGRGLCWVELQDSQIDGQLRAVGATFVAPATDSDAVEILITPKFALDLTHAHVGDTILLGPDVRGATPIATSAIGGVSLSSARIGGDVICDGAKFVATDGPALYAQGMRVDGGFLCQARRIRGGGDPIRFQAEGTIDLQGAKIACGISMDGALVDGELLASHMEVGSDVHLRASDGIADEKWPPMPFKATKQVDLHSAKIHGDLELDGANFDDGIIARSVEVLCDVHVRHLGAENYRSTEEGWYTRPAIQWFWHLQYLVLRVLFARVSRVFRYRTSRPFEPSGPIKSFFAANRIIDFSKAVIKGSFKVEIRIADAVEMRIGGAHDRYKRDPLHRPVFDLRFAHIGVLDDDDGDGFGKDVLLKLDEVRYDVLHRTDGYKNLFQTWKAIWLFFWTFVALISINVWRNPSTSNLAAFSAFLVYGMLVYQIAQDQVFRKASDDRKRWLRLQYRTRTPTAWEFTPEPYDTLSRYFRSIGFVDDARNVAYLRHKLEGKFRTGLLLRPFNFLHRVLFRYGLSPARAIIVFLACLLIGWWGIAIETNGTDVPVISVPLENQWLAAHGISLPRSIFGMNRSPTIHFGGYRIGQVLVVDTDTVNSVIVTKPPKQGVEQFVPGIPNPTKEGAQVGEIPCGKLIDPLLYAVDIFVPALDLNQERKCRVSTETEDWPWRIANTLYVIFGWIVTALTILTVSGLLRRQSELD